MSEPSPTRTEVLIVGAGFAGLGMGIRLKRRGEHDFVIIERAASVGGTWRDNTYPGVACDIPAQLYSFSFRQKHDWSHVFAPGAEIATYLRDAALHEGLMPSIRFDTELTNAVWDDRLQHWRVETTRGLFLARVLVTAAGRLSEPRVPAIPAAESFAGPQFHSARWNHDVGLSGKRVGVVGTGASAIQLVPQLLGAGASVVVFQRSAPYVIPRDDRAYTAEEQQHFGEHPDALDEARQRFFDEAEAGFAQKTSGSTSAEAHRQRAHDHLNAQVSDPVLRQKLTPDYEIGCKRVLISSDYYPAVASSKATLEASALAQLDGARATAASGASYELDALVFATGFETAQLPFSRRIVGRAGERLCEHWMHGMTAFASTTVHGFPNLFLIDGPLASLGHNSAIAMIETQVDYVLGALDLLHEHPEPGALEVTDAAERDYTERLDALSEQTVWLKGGCASWYVDPSSGRQTLLWPGTAAAFRDANGTFDPAPYRWLLPGDPAGERANGRLKGRTGALTAVA